MVRQARLVPQASDRHARGRRELRVPEDAKLLLEEHGQPREPAHGEARQPVRLERADRPQRAGLLHFPGPYFHLPGADPEGPDLHEHGARLLPEAPDAHPRHGEPAKRPAHRPLPAAAERELELQPDHAGQLRDLFADDAGAHEPAQDRLLAADCPRYLEHAPPDRQAQQRVDGSGLDRDEQSEEDPDAPAQAFREGAGQHQVPPRPHHHQRQPRGQASAARSSDLHAGLDPEPLEPPAARHRHQQQPPPDRLPVRRPRKLAVGCQGRRLPDSAGLRRPQHARKGRHNPRERSLAHADHSARPRAAAGLSRCERHLLLERPLQATPHLHELDPRAAARLQQVQLGPRRVPPAHPDSSALRRSPRPPTCTPTRKASETSPGRLPPRAASGFRTTKASPSGCRERSRLSGSK